MIKEIIQFAFILHFSTNLIYQLNNLIDDLIVISKNKALLMLLLLDIHLYKSYLKMIQLINYILISFYVS